MKEEICMILYLLSVIAAIILIGPWVFFAAGKLFIGGIHLFISYLGFIGETLNYY